MTHFATILLFIQNFVATLHPFHASVCEIEHNGDSQALEISYRMFLDDLELTLNRKFGTDLDIMQSDQKEKVDELVERYLTEQFKFWVNGKTVQFDYLGSEIEGYALWCFIEITNVQTPETLEIDNKVMLESFDDQINLVHFNKEDEVRSLKLYKDHTYGSIKVKELFE